MQLGKIFSGLPVRLLTRAPSRHPHEDSCRLSSLLKMAAIIVLIACHDVTANWSPICWLLCSAQKEPLEKSTLEKKKDHPETALICSGELSDLLEQVLPGFR